MLNDYVWKLYLASDGSNTVEFFRKNLEEKMTADYPAFIRKLHECYCPGTINLIGLR